MKYIKLFESFDVEDFDFIFQDLKDDFPEIKWTFSKDLPKILSGYSSDSGNMEDYGMNVYDFKTNRTIFNPNLLGYSSDMRYNASHGYSNGIKKWYKEIRDMSNKLDSYFYQIKNRLAEKGLEVGFYVRKDKRYGIFKYTIIYKPISNKTFEASSADILGIKPAKREEIYIDDFVETLRPFEDKNDFVKRFFNLYDDKDDRDNSISDFLTQFGRGNSDDWEYEFIENIYEEGEYESWDSCGIYQRKSDGKYFRLDVGYDGRLYNIPDFLIETYPKYITKTLWR